MNESRARELRERATALRLEAMETTHAIADELAGVWQELNAMAKDQPELREACKRIAGDIAQLEKLDFTFDVEWLVESKQSRRGEGGDGEVPAADSERG